MKINKIKYLDNNRVALNPNLGKELAESFKTTGFAVIANHHIEDSSIKSFYADWAKYFLSNDKINDTFSPESQDGYFPYKTEQAKGAKHPDLKEFYHYYPNRFGSKKLPQVVNDKTVYMGHLLSTMGSVLLSELFNNTPEKSLNNKNSFSNISHESRSTLFRVLHYPPLTDESFLTTEGIRAESHFDINLITLLPASTEPGLQVQDLNGDWHSVGCEPGDIIVNVGEMLQELTDGYYKATAHRVINGDGINSRYSAPLFMHPHNDTFLSQRYTTAESYLQERLKELGLKK